MDYLWILLPLVLVSGVFLGFSARTARQERYVREVIRGLRSREPHVRQMARTLAAFHGGITALDVRSVFQSLDVPAAAQIELARFALPRYPGSDVWALDAMVHVVRSAPDVADRLNALTILQGGLPHCVGYVPELSTVLGLEPDPIVREKLCEILWVLCTRDPSYYGQVACSLASRLADPCSWISDKAAKLLRQVPPKDLHEAELTLMVLLRSAKPSVRDLAATFILDREYELLNAKAVVLSCLPNLGSAVRARVS